MTSIPSPSEADSTAAAPPQAAPPPSASPFAPLRRGVFRWLWIASLASNTGTWIHDVGAGWAMTEMRPSALMVSLVQAAMTLPMFLLSVPAGALADVVDRRKLMLAMQVMMLAVAAVLALVRWTEALTPTILLLATAFLGIGAAMVNPAWQTAMTDLVPRDELPAASALNSVSLNLSRAVGPAIGGFLVSAAGPAAAFALNAASFLGIIAVLSLWKYKPPEKGIPGERFLGALRAGVRYIRFSPHMKSQLVRTASFTLFASSLWALLPLVARENLGMSAAGYGVLLACMGAGAVGATLVLARVRAWLSPNRLIIVATAVYATAMSLLAIADRAWIGCVATLLAGSAWVSMVVTLNVAAQAGTPSWVRARALACYLGVFYGGMTVGSAAWGAIATRVGISPALLVAAGGVVLALGTMIRFRLATPTAEDLGKSTHWDDPVVAGDLDHDQGPVVVTIEYEIDAEDADSFRAAMHPVSLTRYRDGAISWTLSRCTENPRRWLEIFVVESWAEHLRQHDRVTFADQRVQQRAKKFHRGPGKPAVGHFIAVDVSASADAASSKP